MSMTNEERLAAVHERAMQRFDEIQAAVRDERMQCLKDRRFYSIAGAQWEGDLGDQFENKPRFEMNKIHLAVIRIINEYRNNRVTVDFLPKDGSDNDTLADTCDGLYRADEQDSGAEEAYDNAFEEGVGGGIGAWRLRACYEDEEDEDDDKQRIRIEPIYDADSCVFFALDAKRQDKADANHAFVLTSMTPDAFMDRFGHDPATWPKEIHQTEFDWSTSDVTYIAEYYEVEEKKELLRVFQGLDLGDGSEPQIVKAWDKELQDTPKKLAELTATGFKEIRQKRVKRRRVHKYILSGLKVEEDEGYIAGKCIPIVPFYGKRWFVDNVERCMGHVRLAIDASRLKNMLVSMLAEIATFSPIEKPIFSPEQMAGHAQMWSDDSIKRYPYMLANSLTDKDGNIVQNGPIGYTKPPSIPQALAALLQITEQDIQDLLGNQQAGEEVQANMSGKLMELVQTRLDMQSFIYMSNFVKAMKRSGEIWLSMAKDTYVEEGRKMKIVGPDGKPSAVTLATPAYDAGKQEQYLENDIAQAKFDVISDVGPTSSSRRAATVRALTAVQQVTTDPQDQKILGSMIMMNMEGEGMQDVRAYYRQSLIRMGVIKPTDQEAEELAAERQNAKPDANTVLAESLSQEAQAKAQKAQADSVLAAAKAEQTKAETAKIMSDIDISKQRQILETVREITDAQSPEIMANPVSPI